MNNYQEIVLQELKKSDFKITAPRLVVIELLAESDTALTPYEMRDILMKRGVKADVVTIYRVLEVLEKLGFVHKVNSLGRFVKCHSGDLKSSSKCHHYLLCRVCYKVEEVEGEDLHKLEEKIQRERDFKVETHYLEFSGVCSDCQKLGLK